ncbi:unnamed protein product [Penicillium crustosum]
MYAGHSVIRERTEAAHQGRQGDESEWGFGQVMPVLLLAIPFFQFVEELCSRNRQHYELAVALDRSGLARAWTTPSPTSYPLRFV